jgi:hypothetical protein
MCQEAIDMAVRNQAGGNIVITKRIILTFYKTEGLVQKGKGYRDSMGPGTICRRYKQEEGDGYVSKAFMFGNRAREIEWTSGRSNKCLESIHTSIQFKHRHNIFRMNNKKPGNFFFGFGYSIVWCIVEQLKQSSKSRAWPIF